MEVSDIERKIEVTSMWRIGDVRQKIADALVVGAQALKLAYKISVDKQQKKYRRLENQDDWDEIKRVGTAFRLAELRKKNGNPDNWGVSIKEEAGAPPAKQTKVIKYTINNM